MQKRRVSILFTISAILVWIASGFLYQPASACSCASRIPEKYTDSDVIFVGEITDRGATDNEMYVNFDVSKSWKGIDTESVTVRIDDPGCSTPFMVGREYIAFGYKDAFGARIPACSGTFSTENVDNAERDSEYLDAAYTQIALRAGHTAYVNPVPMLLVLAALVGIGVASFFLIKRKILDKRPSGDH